MTNLDPTTNPIFWQALGEYMRQRIVEQVAEKPAPPKANVVEDDYDYGWQDYQHIKQSIFPE
jgi:hypothetical protein